MEIRLPTQLLKAALGLARVAGISEDRELAGLVRLHERCMSRGSAKVTLDEIALDWGLSRDEFDRFLSTHLCHGVFAHPSGGLDWLVPSCVRYEKLRAALSAGGKKSKGNLRQFSGRGAQQEAAPAVPAGPAPAPPPGKKTRALSDQEGCWAVLEQMRVEHCVACGIAPGSSAPPKYCNKLMNDAVEGAGIVDRILDGGTAFTRWDYLAFLFEGYLGDEFGRVKDGQLRSPPWPVELFLSPGVLRRHKEQEEAAA